MRVTRNMKHSMLVIEHFTEREKIQKRMNFTLLGTRPYFWNSGTQEPWNTGTLGHRNPGNTCQSLP